ncbi:nuclear transport factor 2 family protein [Actinokineospora diospyrosa]|uniref:SnoaL-like domain-containing protein n=1 Tax=Actinokineospora diospyrosa TaxID=103728 RepID=A0ABT1IBK5_9PSEU|nr:nuclear transport factor 2 family protein [Actinokineospora diospyrosa]MCP2269946.1 SnoaL-like domain-containing protein [Actinokineospora diospyrosa]
MSDLNAIVDAYLAVWNRTDATARREMIEALWAEDGAYVDPLVSVTGWAGIDQVVASAQAQFTGMRFVLGDVFDEHHNVVRFTWELVPTAGAEAIVVGFDVAVVNADGRIQSVYGFLDKVPS